MEAIDFLSTAEILLLGGKEFRIVCCFFPSDFYYYSFRILSAAHAAKRAREIYEKR